MSCVSTNVINSSDLEQPNKHTDKTSICFNSSEASVHLNAHQELHNSVTNTWIKSVIENNNVENKCVN